MGDAGEGLIDQESRIQERMEELARERMQARAPHARDPEQAQALESLRLARTELERQLGTVAHERRRVQIQLAIDELTRRMAEASAAINS
jgi:hypothetical protein